MSVAPHTASILCVAVALACGGGERSTLLEHDLALIRPGVDPRAECDQVAAGLREAGFVVGARLDGVGFAALDAAHPDGRTVVRIVTTRGIAWSASADPTLAEPRVALRTWPGARGHDLDGDGRPEIAVARLDPATGRDCLLLSRVAPDGSVLAVPVELGRLGEGACVEEIRDVSGDRRLELLAARREAALARGAVPAVLVPLTVRGDGFSPASAAALARFWAAETGSRRELLTRARAALDVGTAYRIAVELAAIEREVGHASAAQVAAFDAALLGLVLQPDEAVAVGRARGFIAAGWREAAPP